MIASVAPGLRVLLDDQTYAEIIRSVENGVRCMVCEQAMRPGDQGKANVVALRERDTGETLIRFAHENCSESRLVDVDALPDDRPLVDGRPARDVRHEWVLSARPQRIPSIALVWDVDAIAHMAVRGATLLKALRLEGLRGGRGIETITPPHIACVSVTREASVLAVHTPHGDGLLDLEDLEAVAPALRIAARQHLLVLVCGRALALDGVSLDEADRQLQYGAAIAAAVTYKDPELAAKPSRPKRRHRALRGLANLMPAARRRKQVA